jgi:ornithine decarboxylase
VDRQFDDVRSMVQTLQPSYPVYCLRPHVLRQAAQSFLEQFPGRVLYAVKCNPHPSVLRALYAAGIRHFDTASLPEIAQVRESFPDAGAYFMHPVKSRAVIHAAARIYNVDTFVVDHEKEVVKVIDETGGGEGICIVVRLDTPPVEGTFFHLSAKFGAKPDVAAKLLRQASSQGCQVGLAFHVGSQCLVPEAYRDALRIVGETMAAARTPLQILDVGGGFPAQYVGSKTPPLEDFMTAIDAGVKELKLRRDCVLMCEPGRALVAHGVSIVVQVQLRKGNQLYINDGIYGSFDEMVTTKIKLPARMVRLRSESTAPLEPFILNGPTCDSLDVLPGTFELPADIEDGDWIEIDRMGAYSNATASHFNGFYPDTLVVTNDQPMAAVAG